MEIKIRKQHFYCRSCEAKVFHSPIANDHISHPQANGDKYKSFELVKCDHCSHLTLCIHNWVYPGSMMGDSYIEKTDYFPPLFFRLKPTWFKKLVDKKYKLIFLEIYNALDNRLFRLASIGVRTVLDKLIVEKIGDIGSFEKKIDDLFKKNIISEDEKKLLLAVIDAGSASAHRGFIPNDNLVNYLMDIAEHVFEELYFKQKKIKELLAKASKLKKKTPERK